MRVTTKIIRAGAVVAVAGIAASVHAGPIAIMQTTGVGANSFANGLQFLNFDRPNKSGTGAYWVMLVENTSASSSDDRMIITGSGTSYNLASQEGTDEVEPGRTWTTSDRYMDINSSGDWVALANLNAGANTDDEIVLTGDFLGSTLGIAAREGGVSGAGPTYGSFNYGPGITDAGDYSFAYGTPSASSDIIYYRDNGNAINFQQGDVLPGQRGGTTFALETPFSGRNTYQLTSDGSSYLGAGELSNGDAVLIKDGQIVLQEGDLINGEPLDSFRSEQNLLQDNGDWYQRGVTTLDTGVAFKNGSVFAIEGDLVGGSVPGEVWTDVSAWTSSSATVWFTVTGDSFGNTVLGGFTDNPDSSRDAVWTYNGLEFLREGDQIDLDGDGFLDDAFIAVNPGSSASPSPLDGFLADDGFFYTVVDVTNAAGADLGEAFITVRVPSPGAAGLLALGAVAGLRRRRH